MQKIDIRNGRKQIGRKKTTKNFLKLFFIFIFVFLITTFVLTKIFFKNTNDTLVNVLKMATHQTAFPGKEKINILVMGVDASTEDTHRSDTLMIVALNLKKKKANLLSIPRDSRVEISDHGLDKINHSYAFGEIPLVIETVENFLKIKLDYYVKVDFEQFQKAVETLGGVDLEVEKRMKYKDKAGNLYINLYPGYQHLNGYQAMGYVRFRHDRLGDIARVQRQQNFLIALAKKMLQPKNYAKIPKVITQLYNSVETNLDVAQMKELADIYKKVNPEKIQMQTIPGYETMISRISYVIPDIDKSLQLANRLINNVGEIISFVKLGVLNGSGKKGSGKKASEILTREGFEILAIDNSFKNYAKSLLICVNEDENTRQELFESQFIPPLHYKYLKEFLQENPEEVEVLKKFNLIEEDKKENKKKKKKQNVDFLKKEKPDFIILVGKDWVEEGTLDIWEGNH